MLPGNAAQAILGKNTHPSEVAALERELHLNQSLWGQYWYWMGNFVHGNLGRSADAIIGSNSHETVASLIRAPLGNSALLAGITLLLFIPFSIGLGVLLATRAGKWIDNVISISTFGAISLPEFVTGSVLIWLFATNLGVLPPVSLSGRGRTPVEPGHPDHTGLDPAGSHARAMRADGASQDDRGAALGLRDGGTIGRVGERRVLFRYALRNALAPSVQVSRSTLSGWSGASW